MQTVITQNVFSMKNWLGEIVTVTNALAYYTFLQVATVISFYKTDPKCFFIQSLIVK